MNQEMWEMSGRRYIPPNEAIKAYTASDLHAWSIYRQNLNSDFTDSALGSSEKGPLPYGNFQLRDQTVQSILNRQKQNTRSPLSASSNNFLNFGLPRVAPPKNGSSGYDSSDDGSPVLQSSRLRAKSDPDFRNHIIPSQKSDSGWSRENRLKSSSEANLLADDKKDKRDAQRLRKSLKISGSRSILNEDLEKRSQGSLTSRNSRATTRIEGAIYPRDAPLLNDRFFPRDDLTMKGIKIPHLQVRNLNYSLKGKSARILDNISLEIFGGEILGVMATCEEEGSALLATMAGRKKPWNASLRVTTILNGTSVNSQRLRSRVAYISALEEPAPDLTVIQTLKFHAMLRKPARKTKINEEAKMLALMTDLGLEPVRDTKVDKLTFSEKRRLVLACTLQLDTDIIVVDQPAKKMDIFDTFFLVEYLRQWASRGRIVVLTIHPPTYEIFTMLSRIVLISSGRLMYFGSRREMLPYFAFIDFPCPAYKNPADYYLDLVTLDDLSSEAILESSQRVEQLSAAFMRRQEPLSDPGPPSNLTPSYEQADSLITMNALWTRHLVYGGLNRFLRWIWVLFFATSMSTIIGAIYWDSKRMNPPPEQEDITDRTNFNYAIGIVAIWPFLMFFSKQEGRLRHYTAMEIREGLYGPFWYYWTEVITGFISSLSIFLALLLPAFFSSGVWFGMSRNVDIFLHCGYMIMFFLALRAMIAGISTLTTSPHTTIAISSLIGIIISLTAGITIHSKDLSFWVSPLTWGSPLFWVNQPLQNAELAMLSSVSCSRNPVTMQDLKDIIVLKVTCGVSNGTHALEFYGNVSKQYDGFIPVFVVFGFWLLFSILHFVGFFATRDDIKSQKKKYL